MTLSATTLWLIFAAILLAQLKGKAGDPETKPPVKNE